MIKRMNGRGEEASYKSTCRVSLERVMQEYSEIEVKEAMTLELKE